MSGHGIIGFPLIQSLSPQLHNPAFHSIGQKVGYKKFEIAPAKFESDILELLGNSQSLGFNITIPYKEQIAAYCSRLSEEAEQIGAVNTLVREKNGSWVGHNTDWFGFKIPLNQYTEQIRKVLITGAGGSARAIVFALLQFPGIEKIHILNRNTERAEILLSPFRKRTRAELSFEEHALDGSPFQGSEYDLIVNTTPLGSLKEINSQAIKPINLKPGTICYDLIYNPKLTLFLMNALLENPGVIILNGWPMLVLQAAQSFKLWSGKAFSKEWIKRLLPLGNQSFSSSALSA